MTAGNTKFAEKEGTAGEVRVLAAQRCVGRAGDWFLASRLLSLSNSPAFLNFQTYLIESQKKEGAFMIELIGNWGNPPFHVAPGKGIAKRKRLLLRECPDCGCEVLRYRQRVCDKCKVRRRRKTKRENQRNFRRKQRVST